MENEKFSLTDKGIEPGEKSLNRIFRLYLPRIKLNFVLLMRYCLVDVFENSVSGWLQKEELS